SGDWSSDVCSSDLRREDVLLVGELAARERDDGGVAGEGDHADRGIADGERELLARIVRARDREPLGGEEDDGTCATPRQLRPLSAERARVARNTDWVGRGEDHPSLDNAREGRIIR